MYGPAVPSVHTVSSASAAEVAMTLASRTYRVRKWAEAEVPVRIITETLPRPPETFRKLHQVMRRRPRLRHSVDPTEVRYKRRIA